MGGGRKVGRLEEWVGALKNKIGFKDGWTKKKSESKKGAGKEGPGKK